MAVNYAIRAQVIDLRHDRPRPDDAFLADSNVWFWVTYPRATQVSRLYQARDYPAYLRLVQGAGARLFRCDLSVAELSHTIERAERDLFNRSRPPAAVVGTKEYRHNFPGERTQVMDVIDAAWGQVLTLADPIAVLVDQTTAGAAIAHLRVSPIDAYDGLMLDAMAAAGITQFITDDGDFATVPGLQLFTANRTVLHAAQAQGQLRRR